MRHEAVKKVFHRWYIYSFPETHIIQSSSSIWLSLKHYRDLFAFFYSEICIVCLVGGRHHLCSLVALVS